MYIHLKVLTFRRSLTLFYVINLFFLLWIGQPSSYAQSEIAIVDDQSIHIPDEYEVEEGDSLWLISQEFFNDPWLWPNLWALNPHITNPHWIYPGDIINLKWTSQASLNEEQGFNLRSVGYSTDLQKVAQLILNQGLILENTEEILGVMIASPEPKTYLAVGDRVYLKIKKGVE